MTVRAEINLAGQAYCPLCLRNMTPVIGVRFAPQPGCQPKRWLWWRCPNDHITEAIPAPDSVVTAAGIGTVGSVIGYGVPGVQPPGVAGSPSHIVPDR